MNKVRKGQDERINVLIKSQATRCMYVVNLPKPKYVCFSKNMQICVWEFALVTAELFVFGDRL